MSPPAWGGEHFEVTISSQPLLKDSSCKVAVAQQPPDGTKPFPALASTIGPDPGHHNPSIQEPVTREPTAREHGERASPQPPDTEYTGTHKHQLRG